MDFPTLLVDLDQTVKLTIELFVDKVIALGSDPAQALQRVTKPRVNLGQLRNYSVTNPVTGVIDLSVGGIEAWLHPVLRAIQLSRLAIDGQERANDSNRGHGIQTVVRFLSHSAKAAETAPAG